MKIKNISACCLLLCQIGIAQATIYQSNDSAGNISYSDVPGTDSKEISAPTTNFVQTPTTNASSQPTQIKSPNDKPYQTFFIDSPKDQATLQNQPVTSVVLKIQPELRKGDKIQVFLDGKAATQPAASLKFDLNLLERGTHQLYAIIMDNNMNTIERTPTNTIYVHRNSINTSPAPRIAP